MCWCYMRASSTVFLLSVPCSHYHKINKTTPWFSCLLVKYVNSTDDQSVAVCTTEGVNCVEEHIHT